MNKNVYSWKTCIFIDTFPVALSIFASPTNIAPTLPHCESLSNTSSGVSVFLNEETIQWLIYNIVSCPKWISVVENISLVNYFMAHGSFIRRYLDAIYWFNMVWSSEILFIGRWMTWGLTLPCFGFFSAFLGPCLRQTSSHHVSAGSSVFWLDQVTVNQSEGISATPSYECYAALTYKSAALSYIDCWYIL